MYKGGRVCRNGSGWVMLFVILTCLFAGILGLGSIIESLVLRIELTDDALIATDLLGRRRYARADIERVGEAKGSPPALLLKNGKWAQLPSVGDNVGNSVRSWLKHSD